MSPRFDLPRERAESVRLSPHISWSMPESNELLYDTFRSNLARWIEQKPLDYDRLLELVKELIGPVSN